MSSPHCDPTPRPCSAPVRGGPSGAASRHLPSAAATREQHLFLAWRAGDSRAGTLLFRCLRRKLLRYYRSLPTHAAEDLTQEALVACVRARSSLRDVRALRRYLYTVAGRLLARQRSRPETSAVTLDGQELAYGLDCRLDTDRLDVTRLLVDEPSPYAQVMAEYYLEGLRAPEIARRRQVPLGTVRSQLRRGLLRLRQQVVAAA